MPGEELILAASDATQLWDGSLWITKSEQRD